MLAVTCSFAAGVICGVPLGLLADEVLAARIEKKDRDARAEMIGRVIRTGNLYRPVNGAGRREPRA